MPDTASDGQVCGVSQESRMTALEVVKQWTEHRGYETWDPFLVQLIAQALDREIAKRKTS